MITSKTICKIRQIMYLNYKLIKYRIIKLDLKKEMKKPAQVNLSQHKSITHGIKNKSIWFNPLNL